MAWLVSLLGGMLVLIALRDIFHTLWHPSGFGRLARSVFRMTWKASKFTWLPRRLCAVTGPLGLLGVVALWTSLLVTGWALVYLPHLPEAFNFSTSLTPFDSSQWVQAGYLSFVTLTTVGFGDIVPEPAWLRLLVPLEGLLGFLLLTAAISWILQVYPALIRRRTLAGRLSLIERSGAIEVVRDGRPEIASALLDAVTVGLAGARVDLRQYAETYYFRDGDRRQSLAANLPLVLDLIKAGKQHPAREVAITAAALEAALGDLTELLAASYLDCRDSPPAVVRAFAQDHHR